VSGGEGVGIFVVGCPRSGTTFLGEVLGALPGRRPLGEYAPLKDRIPELVTMSPEGAAAEIAEIISSTTRNAPKGEVAVIDIPEMVFLLDALEILGADVAAVHILRDPRDVVCSLVETGWLSSEATDPESDSPWQLGSVARFWTEPERRAEFPQVSEAQRAAWTWRSHVEAARKHPEILTVSYESLCLHPEQQAPALASLAGVPEEQLHVALGRARASSVGRWHRELDEPTIEVIDREIGGLRQELGFID
jgi:hypothetical protein